MNDPHQDTLVVSLVVPGTMDEISEYLAAKQRGTARVLGKRKAGQQQEDAGHGAPLARVLVRAWSRTASAGSCAKSGAGGRSSFSLVCAPVCAIKDFIVQVLAAPPPPCGRRGGGLPVDEPHRASMRCSAAAGTRARSHGAAAG